MKSAHLYYFDQFVLTPMSGWAGARMRAWVPQVTNSGQSKRPKQIRHPFLDQRKQWCVLFVNFRGVNLYFSTPQDLDIFLNTIEQKVLPSGGSLIRGRGQPGRPNKHWLSRLPKGAHSLKFRDAISKYLRESAEVKAFRQYYEAQPVQYDFPDVFDSYFEANLAYKRKLSNER